jgi:hypothetical protein
MSDHLMHDRNGRRVPNGNPHYHPENGGQFSHTCPEPCGKRAYRTRKAARAAARRHDQQVRTYRCLTDTDVYHIGHLHKDVTAGKVSRGKVYRRD